MPELLKATVLGRQFAKLVRPQNVVYSGLLAALSCYYLTEELSTSVLCYLYFSFAYSVAVIYNNFMDRTTDVINKRTDNPLAHGQMPILYAKVFFFINLALFCLIQFGLDQPISVILGLLYLALSFAYSNQSLNIQSRGWWAPLLLAACYGSLPLLLGIVQAQDLSISSSEYGVLAAAQIFLLYPVLLAKDYKDIAGDKLSKKRTPLVINGPIVVRRVANVTAVLSICFCLTALFFKDDPAKVVFPLFIVYGLFVWYVHYRQGRPNWLLQKLGMVCILAISLMLLGDLI